MVFAGLPSELIILIILIAIVLLAFIGMLLLANRIRGMVFNKRYDDNNTLKYFYAKDFENLVVEPIEFVSKGNTIKGFVYSDSSLISYKGVIVFSHGLGVGHNQYTTEIDYLAKLGYLVVAYDVSGTANSEGKSIKGITTALYNLDDCLKFVENHPVLSKYKKMVFGHSMGAYASNNITRYNHELVGIVSISGFDTPYGLLSDEITMVNGMEIKALTNAFKFLDRMNFGKEGLWSSLDAFRKTNVRHIIVSGDKDNIVNISKNYELFKEELKDNSNFEFMLVEGRYHRPLLSLEAATYDQETNVQLSELKKEYKNKIPDEVNRKYYDSLDYKLLVELDYQVMSEISQFIENCFKS